MVHNKGKLLKFSFSMTNRLTEKSVYLPPCKLNIQTQLQCTSPFVKFIKKHVVCTFHKVYVWLEKERLLKYPKLWKLWLTVYPIIHHKKRYGNASFFFPISSSYNLVSSLSNCWRLAHVSQLIALDKHYAEEESPSEQDVLFWRS